MRGCILVIKEDCADLMLPIMFKLDKSGRPGAKL
jgi:hypothetical protein